jgi:hypothetical protein
LLSAYSLTNKKNKTSYGFTSLDNCHKELIMLYLGALASSSKPLIGYLFDRMVGKPPLNQPQKCSSHIPRQEKNQNFLPEKYNWHCHPKKWEGKSKLVAKHTCCVKTTSYYYGTLLHSWDVLGELYLPRCRGSRLCEFR